MKGALNPRRADSPTPVLIVTTLVCTLTPFMSSAVNVALPNIGAEFGMDAVDLGWVVNAFFLACAVMLVVFGRLADILGKIKIFNLGVIMFGMGSLLCAISLSAGLFIAGRLIQGVGGSMTIGTGLAALTAAYPPEERGRVLGINAAAVYFGLSIGPTIGGFLTTYWGWRSNFYLVFGLLLFSYIMTIRYLNPDEAEARDEKFDHVGSLLYVPTLTAFLYGFSNFLSPHSVPILAAGVAGLVAFIFWERRFPDPLIDLRIFKSNRPFIMSNLATLVNYAAVYAVTLLLSLYFQYNRGLAPEMAGLLLGVTPAAQVVFAPLAGRWSDRMDSTKLASLGLGITTLGLVLLCLFDEETPILYFVLCLAINGAGYGIFSSPNMNSIMSSASRKWYGVASSLMVTSRQVGCVLSTAITMVIFSIFIGHVELTAAQHGSLALSAKTAFIIFACLNLVAVFLSLARGKSRPATEPTA
ncbi:MAG: MFS transporter [Deltaproteobacteria bacterium]|nr:MFS transporter [Deltaproteobacteria bacterium]